MTRIGLDGIEVCLTQQQLEDILDKAVERGALEALKKIGLGDASASNDIREFKDFLSAWHFAKKTAFETFVRWITFGILGVMATAIVVWGRSHMQ